MIRDSYIAQGVAIASRQLGGDVVIMSAADSTLFSLNESAALIWLAADGQTRLRDIVERVVIEQFEVDSQTALRDAEKFATELASHGILSISDRPIALRGDETPAQPVGRTLSANGSNLPLKCTEGNLSQSEQPGHMEPLTDIRET